MHHFEWDIHTDSSSNDNSAAQDQVQDTFREGIKSLWWFSPLPESSTFNTSAPSSGNKSDTFGFRQVLEILPTPTSTYSSQDDSPTLEPERYIMRSLSM